MWGAVHSAAEARTEDAGDQRQLRTATNHVEAGDVAAQLTNARCVGHQQGFHGLDRRFDQGSGGLVEVRDGNCHGLSVDGYGDELRRGREGLLRVA